MGKSLGHFASFLVLCASENCTAFKGDNNVVAIINDGGGIGMERVCRAMTGALIDVGDA